MDVEPMPREELRAQMDEITTEAEQLFNKLNVEQMVKTPMFTGGATGALMKLVDDHQPYSFYVADLGGHNEISRSGDILMGIAFPDNEPGDTIEFHIHGRLYWSFTLKDPDRFHMPFLGQYGIPLISISFMSFRVTCPTMGDMRRYAVYAMLDSPARRRLAMGGPQYYFPEATFRMDRGMFERFVPGTDAIEKTKKSIVFEGEYRDNWKVHNSEDVSWE